MQAHRAPRLALLLTAALLVVPIGAPVAAGQPSAAGQPPNAGRTAADDSWIVTLASGVNAVREARGLALAAGGTTGFVYEHAVNGFQFLGSAAAADALRRNPRVVSVQPDYAVALTESLPNGIKRISAYNNNNDPASSAYHAGYRGAGARIAIMDTGIDLDHPDLAGAIDQSLGKNCVNSSLPPEDGYGHGTHVAGTAAAPLNGVGVVGVAPDARLVAVKIFDDGGSSSESLVLCGFDHVLALNADANSANDVDVLSMSFGEQRSWGTCATDALHGAVCNASAAGIIMVAGAGNSAVDAGSFVPAAFPEVISVSALTDLDANPGGLGGCQFILELFTVECDDTFAVFSNYGASVDVMAPGVAVYSTTKNAGYATQSGTSMATPHVSGVVALMVGANPALTPTAAMALLRQSGECPNGSVAGADAACAGQGTWADDPDGTPEPLVHALRAAQAVGAPPDPIAPGAPNLTAATPDDGRVDLAWTAPFSDGGSAITGYEVWRGASSGAEAWLADVVSGTTYADTAVTNGTTYFYVVKARNVVGLGPASNERSATPNPPPPPPPPPPPSVSRVGGASSNFASASSASGSVAFTLPTGTDELVVMVSLNSTTIQATAVTWAPDPGNPAANQAMTRLGRQAAPSAGSVEIWALANPTAGVAGSAVTHTLSANAKRVMGVHALDQVGSVGPAVGTGVNGTAISVNVASGTGGLVLDVLYGQNSTTAYTAGAGQTEHWDTNTTSGLSNLRGAGSSEVGAASVTMSWTAGAGTNMALLGVAFSPGEPPPPPPPPDPTAPGAPNLTAATAGDGRVDLAWSAPASDGGSAITLYEVWRGASSGTEAWLADVPSGTTYADTAVTNGTTYFYVVKARNAVGLGPASNERSATPNPPPPPPPPPPPSVTRTGGASSNFASASSASGSVAFNLPADSNYLVAMVSLNSTSTQVTGVTWKPDPANAAADQALTRLGRQTAPSGGSVEIWALADPAPGVAGSAVTHTLSANAKRIMGIHALAGVGSVGSAVGAGVNGTAISVNVASATGGLVLDVIYGQNSTTAYTAGAGQTEHWDANTTSGLANLRGAGSAESGAASVAMSWTAKKATAIALLAVSFTTGP